MAMARIALLEEAASILEAAGGPCAPDLQILEAFEKVENKRTLTKATKRYWKAWTMSVLVRHSCLLLFKDEAIDWADSPCEPVEAPPSLEALNANSQKTAAVLEALTNVKSQLLERKRAEAETDVTPRAAEDGECDRTTKQSLRLQLQQEEEELRVLQRDIETKEIVSAKAIRNEKVMLSKMRSHANLRRKVRFEEAAERFQLLIEDLDLLNDCGEGSHKNLNCSASEIGAQDDFLGFSCRAGTFLKNHEEELERQRLVGEAAKAWMQSEADGVRGMCLLRRDISPSDDGSSEVSRYFFSGLLGAADSPLMDFFGTDGEEQPTRKEEIELLQPVEVHPKVAVSSGNSALVNWTVGMVKGYYTTNSPGGEAVSVVDDFPSSLDKENEQAAGGKLDRGGVWPGPPSQRNHGPEDLDPAEDIFQDGIVVSDIDFSEFTCNVILV